MKATSTDGTNSHSRVFGFVLILIGVMGMLFLGLRHEIIGSFGSGLVGYLSGCAMMIGKDFI